MSDVAFMEYTPDFLKSNVVLYHLGVQAMKGLIVNATVTKDVRTKEQDLHLRIEWRTGWEQYRLRKSPSGAVTIEESELSDKKSALLANTFHICNAIRTDPCFEYIPTLERIAEFYRMPARRA